MARAGKWRGIAAFLALQLAFLPAAYGQMSYKDFAL